MQLQLYEGTIAPTRTVPLQYSLLFWFFVAWLLGALCWSAFRKRGFVGTYASAAQAFYAPPGWLFFKRVAQGRFGTHVVEYFVVSVAVAKCVDFKIVSKVPSGVRLEKLRSYSDTMAISVLEGALKFQRRGTSLTWTRKELEILAVALSTIPFSKGGTLEARNGRMVLSWRRGLGHHELSKQLKDPTAEVLNPTQRQLAELATQLRIVGNQ